jgi:stearoyl-CoA desaturase (delta-9 desaturase)
MRRRWSAGPDWANIFWIVVLHLGVLAAPWTFTWPGLALFLVMGWLTGGIGICLGYHRLFTHRSFATYRPLRWFIAWLGGLAGQGSAVHWVANHRKHHAFSDQIGDPHSPVDGPWWSHMVWLFPAMRRDDYVEHNRRWAPDLARDPMLLFLDRTFILWHLLLGGVLYAVGYYFGGAPLAWSLLVWGLFLRLVWVLHSTWFVNSATHIWGYRNYNTTDHSRNLWWVALLTYGEGWHNNHHAYPRMARYGHRWWEFDVTFLTIRLLEKLGLAWDVVDHQHKKRLEDNTVTTPVSAQTVAAE